jgi:hypothetical protein
LAVVEGVEDKLVQKVCWFSFSLLNLCGLDVWIKLSEMPSAGWCGAKKNVGECCCFVALSVSEEGVVECGVH